MFALATRSFHIAVLTLGSDNDSNCQYLPQLSSRPQFKTAHPRNVKHELLYCDRVSSWCERTFILLAT